MKGQTQAVTTVLITTIIVGAIAAAYTWGTPLLEKRESQASLTNDERDILKLHSAITEVANSGKGSTREVQFSIEKGGITVNQNPDYIRIRTETENSPYPSDTWQLISGKSVQNLSIGTGNYGLKGSENSGVVAAQGSEGSSGFVDYRIEFRNLKSGDEIEKIDLRSVGSNRANGEVTVLVRNTGIETDSSFIVNGNKLERKRTVVEVDLQ